MLVLPSSPLPSSSLSTLFFGGFIFSHACDVFCSMSFSIVYICLVICTHSCYLTGTALYVAVVAPLAIVTAASWVIFMVIICRLHRHRVSMRKRFTETDSTSPHDEFFLHLFQLMLASAVVCSTDQSAMLAVTILVERSFAMF